HKSAESVTQQNRNFVNSQKTVKVPDPDVACHDHQQHGDALAQDLVGGLELYHVVSKPDKEHQGDRSDQISNVRNGELPSPDAQCHKRGHDKSNPSHGRGYFFVDLSTTGQVGKIKLDEEFD